MPHLKIHRLLATPNLSGSIVQPCPHVLQLLDINLEGIGGSSDPMVTDVSVMVDIRVGYNISPSFLICCSKPATAGVGNQGLEGPGRIK